MRPEFAPWPHAIAAAGGASGVILALFYYWFAVADRYAVFLYEHLGAAPFDAVTRSRYWMAGLVAAGVVLLLYTGANWAMGRLATLRGRVFRPSPWKQVWLLSAAPLILGVVWITTTQNAPTLPMGLALQAALSALVGLGLALWPGAWAAQRPLDLLWLMAEGAGVALVLQLAWAVELPKRGLVAPALGWALGLGSLIASALWLAGMAIVRRWRGRPSPEPALLLAAGFSICYLLLPLAHYLFGTPPGYRYITTAGNFFASERVVQALVWAEAVGIVVVTNYLERRYVVPK